MKSKLLIVLCICNHFCFGQTDIENFTHTIFSKDSMFWHGYNTCQYDLMETYLDKNVEFYHDKGGLMTGAKNVMEATRKNICGNPGIKITRVAIPESINLYPLEQNGQVYGAILVGDHYFYQNGIKTGIAKFTHTWLLKGGLWQMHRILSYDHQPATDIKTISITGKELNMFAGHYSSPQFGQVVIKQSGTILLLENGGKIMELLPKDSSGFYIKGRNIEFRFTKGIKFDVIENGKLVDEVKFIK